MSKRLVSQIWIYPVKSFGGISVHSANLLPKGLEYDRRWMLIDNGNMFMTQRDYPRMALFKLSLTGDVFTIFHSGEMIDLPFQYESEPIRARVWNDMVKVCEVSREHSRWISERLGVACRLVAFPEMHARAIDANYAFHHEQVSLADGYPVLIIGQSSLDDLNGRMEMAVPMNRFRPNIVFTGGEDYEEDGWKNFRIGNCRFAGVKPCARCVLTTVDQETGLKGTEPLATLATYRRRESKVYFGQNLIPLNFGEIAIGDEIVQE